MTNHRNKQNYRFRTWKFRDRCHLKGGVRQGCFLSLIDNYLIQYIHFHSLYMMSHYYAKFKENPCVGTDASTPFKISLFVNMLTWLILSKKETVFKMHVKTLFLTMLTLSRNKLFSKF